MSRGAPLRLCLASGLIAVSAACSDVVGPAPAASTSGEPTAIEVRSTSLLSQVTGANGTTSTAVPWDVHATDLGHMFWHRDVLYMVFGDTFGEGGLPSGRHWRSNVLARVAPPHRTRGSLRIESMVSAPDGTAREILPSRKVDGDEMTVIPTGGVSTGSRMFLHYMSVKTWQGHGHWEVGHSGLAHSDDDGESWVVPDTAIWPTGLGFEQVAFVREAGLVYSFGIPSGRFGGVRLRRVPEQQMLDPAAHECWTGTGWTTDTAEAVVVVPGPVGELSVAWNEQHQQWMMLYLDSRRDEVMLRFAPDITGPWGAPQTVVSGKEHPGLYAPYIVPMPGIGNEVWFTMSKWSDYNVFLMGMTLGLTD
jgi:hypothetical protein